jgi:hypothetical protein
VPSIDYCGAGFYSGSEKWKRVPITTEICFKQAKAAVNAI